MAKNTIFRLQWVQGENRARRIEAPAKPTEAGAYEVADRLGASFFLLAADGAITPCESGEAEAAAMREMTPLQQIENDVLAERDGVPEYEPEAEQDGDLGVRLARAVLAEAKPESLDWTVRMEPIFDCRGKKIRGYRAVTREYDDLVLSVMGAFYVPQQNRRCLSLLDAAARARLIEYTTAWETPDHCRVAIGFRIPRLQHRAMGENDYRFQAGGAVTTSHDGTALLSVYATVNLDGIQVYAPRAFRWRHTRSTERILAAGEEAMVHVTRSAEDLCRSIEAAMEVADEEAAPIVAAEICEKPADMDETISLLHKAVEDRRAHYRSFGGADFAIAAAFLTNRATERSLTWGAGRKRITKTLLALARASATRRANIAPVAKAAS